MSREKLTTLLLLLVMNVLPMLAQDKGNIGNGERKELLENIELWLGSKETYTVRFGIGMLMEHYLDEDYDIKYPAMVAAVRSDEYYINMMIAWYFATALAKQYETVLPFIENNSLSDWTHNKAIQKSVESYRITQEQKDYLRSLKIKGR